MIAMICSMFMLHKTTQDVTKEILFELDQINYPLIPFEIKGSECSQLRIADSIKSDILFIRDLIQLWIEDRSSEKWKMESFKVSQKILRGLKSINMDEITLYSITDGEELDVKYYTEMLLSYLVKLGMIATTLSQWMDYLLDQETANNGELHYCLKTYQKTK